MSVFSTNAPLGNQVANAVSAIASHFVTFMERTAEANDLSRKLERLSNMSDAELAARGTSREEQARAIVANSPML